MNHTPGKLKVGTVNHRKQMVDIDAIDPGAWMGYAEWSRMFKVYGCYDEPVIGSKVMRANAERLVACWNACVNIPTEVLLSDEWAEATSDPSTFHIFSSGEDKERT